MQTLTSGRAALPGRGMAARYHCCLITLSVVSHGQGAVLGELLADLLRLGRRDLRIVLTLNVPEPRPQAAAAFGDALQVIVNRSRLGFGANHNQAFAAASGEYFCVVNPDIRLPADPFPPLLAQLERPGVVLAAPCIVDAAGAVEDSARHFPTAGSLARKLLGRAPRIEYEFGAEPISPDWVSGAFMLLRREGFAAVGGFDERYFLYYEDVDLCRRLRSSGRGIRYVPAAKAVHAAQRASRRSARHMLWHGTSMLRYLLSR